MIKKQVILNGLSSSSDIEAWTEKIPAALNNYIESGDESATVVVRIRRFQHHASGEKFLVEADLRARKSSLHADTENENLASAIEIVRDELVSELASKKKKHEHFIRKGGRAVKNFIRGLYERKKR